MSRVRRVPRGGVVVDRVAVVRNTTRRCIRRRPPINGAKDVCCHYDPSSMSPPLERSLNPTVSLKPTLLGKSTLWRSLGFSYFFLRLLAFFGSRQSSCPNSLSFMRYLIHVCMTNSTHKNIMNLTTLAKSQPPLEMHCIRSGVQKQGSQLGPFCTPRETRNALDLLGLRPQSGRFHAPYNIGNW